MQPVVDFNFEMIHIIWVSILGSAKLMQPLQAHTPSGAVGEKALDPPGTPGPPRSPLHSRSDALHSATYTKKQTNGTSSHSIIRLSY